jgi:hypothetical protein
MSVVVPGKTVCANTDCGHSLSDHVEGDQEMSLTDIKHQVLPCLNFERGQQVGTFAVCGCTDFEPPVSKPEAVAPVVPPGSRVVTSSFIAGVRLNFHEGGSVSWEPVPGVSVP